MTQRHFAAVLATFAGAVALWPPVAASAEQARPPVSLEIEVLTHDPTGTGYVITLHNNLDVAQQVVMAQRFAQPPRSATASDNGQLSPEQLSWAVELPPSQPRAVTSQVVFDSPNTTLTTACVAENGTGRILDCAAGDLAADRRSADSGFGWVQWLLVLLGLAVLGGAGYLLVRYSHRWSPRVARFAKANRSGIVVIIAALALFGLSAAALGYVSRGAKALVGGGQAYSAIGWSGEQRSMAFGAPAATRHTEFTLYHWHCVHEAEVNQCVATAAIRNISNSPQQWFRRMQRLHVDNTWLEPDAEATAAANGVADPFAGVLLDGERRIAVLVFKLAEKNSPSRLELRDGAFSRGVAFNLQ